MWVSARRGRRRRRRKDVGDVPDDEEERQGVFRRLRRDAGCQRGRSTRATATPNVGCTHKRPFTHIVPQMQEAGSPHLQSDLENLPDT